MTITFKHCNIFMYYIDYDLTTVAFRLLYIYVEVLVCMYGLIMHSMFGNIFWKRNEKKYPHLRTTYENCCIFT
jgi:hypothetical protein